MLFLKISNMSVYSTNFSQTLKKCLIMISSKHTITATIEGNVVDLIDVGKLEIELLEHSLYLLGAGFLSPLKCS